MGSTKGGMFGEMLSLLGCTVAAFVVSCKLLADPDFSSSVVVVGDCLDVAVVVFD